MLYFGPHNLCTTSLSNIFQSEHESATEVSSSVGLNREEKARLMEVLEDVCSHVGAQKSIVWDCFDEDGQMLETKDEAPGPSANEEALVARWNARSLRIVIRRVALHAHDLIELRVACVGNVDSGKSTTLGVLTKGRLDDGRGKARVSLFRHKHELESGRTSSVGMEIMGFDAKGEEVLPEGAMAALADRTSATSNAHPVGLRKQQLSWDEICRRAAKVVSFIDLAGHERYLKTTIFGLTGCAPDFVLLIIGANAGLIGMSKEHLSVALALSVPVVAIVTKVDMTPANVLDQTLKQLVKILKSPGCRKVPVFVKNDGMACEVSQRFIQERVCPIFMISNVTGEGLGPLKLFLNTLPSGVEGQYPIHESLEFSISDVFSVPFVGTVVSGVILSGKMAVGDEVLLGPDSLGHFALTTIKSMQRKRVNVEHAVAGQSVSISLKRIKRSGVRKGMVILSKTLEPPPRAVKKFEGQILILYHNSTIQPNYQAMLHVGSVRQTVRILDIEKSKVLRTGDRAQVSFEFMNNPEFVKKGQKLLFRELSQLQFCQKFGFCLLTHVSIYCRGKTKALGVITSVSG
ncbi:P-loop containing nucleoside triphosphate hydrolase protein [Melampsora americana]|nr:P-loop containing nucleoside triphosphate hydrolase protein [Melampsora americana]